MNSIFLKIVLVAAVLILAIVSFIVFDFKVADGLSKIEITNI